MFFKAQRKKREAPISSLSSARKRIKDKVDFQNGTFTYKKMRTTVRTNLAELKVPPHIADRILNHSTGTTADAHYDAYFYVDEQRAALQKWSDKLERIINGEE